MLKILQDWLQQYMNQELPDVQVGFRKGRGTRVQIANIRWLMKKAREFQKTSASLTTLKPLTVWITTNQGKFLEMGVPDHLTCLLRNLKQNKKQQLELDMELVQNWERSMSMLHTVTLLIQIMCEIGRAHV